MEIKDNRDTQELVKLSRLVPGACFMSGDGRLRMVLHQDILHGGPFPDRIPFVQLDSGVVGDLLKDMEVIPVNAHCVIEGV